MRRNDDARVLGPYAEKDRWRLVILEKGVRRSEYLATEKEAQKRKAQLTKRMESFQEYTVNSLITAYTEEKERLGTALPLTCKSHATSLRIILAPILEKTVISVTPATAERLYAELIGTPNARTGRPVAIATHRFYLATARHMFGWAVKKGFITTNPFGAVTPVGKPKAGKKQLRIEEARLFIETALKRYEKKRKPVLLAAVMALTMGLRASEILKRQVRDLDDGCGILWIDQGKTHNARRHLRIPEAMPMSFRAKATRPAAASRSCTRASPRSKFRSSPRRSRTASGCSRWSRRGPAPLSETASFAFSACAVCVPQCAVAAPAPMPVSERTNCASNAARSASPCALRSSFETI